MIAAATQQIASGKMLFNWFDVTLVLVILFGFWRGRRNGMTKEFLPVSLWLTLVIGGAAGYEPLGNLFIQQGYIKSLFGKNVTEQTVAYLGSYLIIATVAFFLYTLVKHQLKHRLEGSNFFGSGEYYLGMGCGMLRYACIIVFALALLNAPFYTAADISQQKFLANKNFGGGLAGYSGDFFPTLSELQISVFQESLTGPFLKNNLAMLLVQTDTGKPVGPAATQPVIYFGK